MSRPTLSLVIPAYNEEKRIGETLRRVGTYFSTISSYRRLMMPLPVEVIVVINNTTDHTQDIVNHYAEKYPFISSINIAAKTNKGGAVAIGFEHAQGEYVAFIDADGSSSPREIMKLYESLVTKNADVAIANRYNSHSLISGNMPLARTIFSRLFNFFGVRLLFGLPYTDTQCGLKLFKADVAKTLASKFVSTGWTFDLNLILLAKHLGYKVVEVPTVWIYRPGSTLRPGIAILMVTRELLNLKWLETQYMINKLIKVITLGAAPEKVGLKQDLVSEKEQSWR